MPRKIPPHRGAALFPEPPSASEASAAAKSSAVYVANVDGGSRGNPGPAAYGVVIRNPRGEVVARMKKYIGRMTNNVAEYYGLIAALDYAQAHGFRALRVESDSELLVNQMRGRYRVKSADLRPLFERAKKMSQTFEFFKIEHVYREQNAEADKLANEALDETSGGKANAPEMRSSKIETGNAQSQTRDATSAIKIRARFRSGVLYPLEHLNLPDGAEVEILLRSISKK
jgi:ribonuclease HI